MLAIICCGTVQNLFSGKNVDKSSHLKTRLQLPPTIAVPRPSASLYRVILSWCELLVLFIKDVDPQQVSKMCLGTVGNNDWRQEAGKHTRK